MASVVQRLDDARLISPPPWLPSNMVMEVMMGSVAYGVSTDTSDTDVYGICIPLKSIVFPHLAGRIHNFGRHRQEFEVWQQHHVEQPAHVGSPTSYDLQVYNIVKFFSLAMECNPNIVDALFVPQFCVLSSTHVGNLIRENRKMFLHKGAWPKFKGYSFSQLHKVATKNPQPGSKRAKDIEKHGFDSKYLYHVVRLLSEVEMILQEGDLDLQRNKEHLKAIRRGEVSEAEVRRWFSDKEAYLEKLYETSKLPHSPDEEAIKTLLLNCLEAHYGTLGPEAIVRGDEAANALREIASVIERNKKLL